MLRLTAVVWGACLVVACDSQERAGSAPDAHAGTSGSSDGQTAGGRSPAGLTGAAGAAGLASAGRGGAVAEVAGGGVAGADPGHGGSGSGGADYAGSGAAGMGGAHAVAGAGAAASRDLPQLAAPITPGEIAAASVTLEVRTDKPLRWIAREIYGTNGAPDIATNRQTVVRSGGNRMTAYNWENNASNAGSDWHFQNDAFLSSSDEPAKPILDAITEAAAHAAASIVTVPIVDYVAADKLGDGDVRDSGADYLQQRFKHNQAEKSGALGEPDVNDDAVYQDEFVAYIKQRAPAGAQVWFSLDNEPDLWSSTHEEVHPDPVTYAELWERSQRYASAVKRVWPEALVLGPVSYGWNGYVTLQNASDAADRDFLDFYLDQARAEAEQRGGRLIDYLDLHWYPEAQGGGTRIIEDATGDAVVAAREQAPRSLWDDSYVEQSWIEDSLQGEPIALITRLSDKIAGHYPDTRLAFTEWNYGGGQHISGAIACADVLGIFGRYGVGLATYWALHSDESFAYAAFRAYRNYDGASGEFGDVSLEATSSDVEHVTVYASLQADDPSRVVIIAINKDTAERMVGLRLAHPSAYAQLERYELTGASAELVAKPALASSAANAWALSLPAQSVSVLVPQP